MAKKLTDLVCENNYLSSLPPEKACRLVYLLLARIIRDFEFRFLSSYKTEKLSFLGIRSEEDIYVPMYSVPDRTKCQNLIRLIQIVTQEDRCDQPTDRWTTIRDFWYRVQKRRNTPGHSDIEKVLDPIARLDGHINLFHLLGKTRTADWIELEKWDDQMTMSTGKVKRNKY